MASHVNGQEKSKGGLCPTRPQSAEPFAMLVHTTLTIRSLLSDIKHQTEP